MKQMSVLVIALFLSSAVFASSIVNVEGILSARSGKPFLNVGAKKIELVPCDRHVSGDLNKLHVGDFLSGYGVFDEASSTLQLQAIETVGLKELLGRWRSADGEVFEFRNFTTLVHYKSVISQWVHYAKEFIAKSATANRRELNYALAPGSKLNRWSIFVADKQALLIGYVEFGARSMLLTLIDPSTGRAVQKIELRLISKR